MASAIDYLPGDPAMHIIGKPDEKPARKHAPQPPKPSKTARGISADIKLRIQEIEPQIDALVKEHAMLQRLDFILNPPTPKRKYTRKTDKARTTHKRATKK